MEVENKEELDQSDLAATIEEDGGYLADPENQEELEFREELFGDTGTTSDEEEALGEAEDGSEAQVEAASLESGESEGAVPTGEMPSPPSGFTSWEQAYEAQTRRAQALEYQQQQAHYQQVAQTEQRQVQQQGFEWQLPHQQTADLQMAMRLRGTEGYDKLSPLTRNQADEQSNYMQGHWDRWTVDPRQLMQDVALPMLAPMFREMQQQIAEIKALEFRRKNQADLGTPEDVHRYRAMVESATRDPYQASLQLLRAEKLLNEAQAGNQSDKTRSRDRQARQQSARGKPAGKNRAKGRRGKAKTKMSKKERASAPKVANAVIRQMLEAGSLTQNDLDG